MKGFAWRLILAAGCLGWAGAAGAEEAASTLYRPQVDVEADPIDFYSPKLFKERNAPDFGEFLFIEGKRMQSFDAYLASRPLRPTQGRHTIYLCILGPADADMPRVVKLGAAFLETYYGLPTKVLPPIPLKGIATDHVLDGPPDKIGYDAADIMNRLLVPNVPQDSLVLIGCLRPALYEKREGTMCRLQSFDRQGITIQSFDFVGWAPFPADRSQEQTVVRRGLHNLVAGAARTLNLPVCHRYYCGLNLGFGPAELDTLPLEMCPGCLKKIRWNLGLDPLAHCEAVRQACSRLGLKDDAEWYGKRVDQLRRALKDAKTDKGSPPAKAAPKTGKAPAAPDAPPKDPPAADAAP
jgi:hypothetical protein